MKTLTTETRLFQKDPSDLGFHYLPFHNSSFYALLCLLGNFSCFCFLSADFFQNYFFLYPITESVKWLDPDQGRHSVGPVVGLKLLATLSAEDLGCHGQGKNSGK